MANKENVAINDIYLDSRISLEAYKQTFVKSLAMIPIRTESPIGAIGIYWAKERSPSAEELDILQSLTDVTSVALENIAFYGEQNKKISELEQTNYAFIRDAGAISHDMREPLRAISSSLQLIEGTYAQMLDETCQKYLSYATIGSQQLQKLLKDLLEHTNLMTGRSPFQPIDAHAVVQEAIKMLETSATEAQVRITVGPLPAVRGTVTLLTQLFTNLISNSIKFRSPDRQLSINISAVELGGEWVFTVQDNGIGIFPEYHKKIVDMFEQVHPQIRLEGGGLVLCEEIVRRLGGKISVESVVGQGTSFYLTFPALTSSFEEVSYD